MLSCSIHHCGAGFSIDWFAYSDSRTQVPFPISTTNSAVPGTPELNKTTSEITINTVGVVNDGLSQMCQILYEDQSLDERRSFDFTLESE